MPQKCCICKIRKDSPGCFNLSFHRITTDEKIREKWKQIIKSNFGIEYKTQVYVCNLHFEKECFYYSGLCKNRMLRKGSCPTILSNFKDNEVQDHTKYIEENYSEISIKESRDNKAFQNEKVDVSIKSNGPNQPIIKSEPNNTADEPITQVIEQNLGKDEYAKKTPCGTFLRQTFKKSLKDENLEFLNLDYSVQNFVKMKDILRRGKAEVIELRRKNNRLRTKLHRCTKQIKSLKSLISHMKERNYTSDKVSDILKVSSN
ncbi:uncharacterized protein LOC143181876 [Calliopsis andreniformis]|uniref:uncharacterized protein LOC143181876 n=1 Tax=Calliopsis andreniformis TaxID=337506 RepID=UPI003FCC6EFB